MSKHLTLPHVIEILKKRQGKRPASELADELGISKSYLSEIYSGRREPGETVLSTLGLQRTVIYEATGKESR
jgi:transcriptional regulator with XRE-family HTH domain